jgi:hypothetical protein
VSGVLGTIYNISVGEKFMHYSSPVISEFKVY